MMFSMMNNAAVDCDCTAVDNEGKTALHWTVTNKDPSCVLALIDAYPPILNRRYSINYVHDPACMSLILDMTIGIMHKM